MSSFLFKDMTCITNIRMKRIVLMKSESDGPDKFSEGLEGHNFSVISISSISFRFTSDGKLKELLKKPNCYDGIVFTSPRAVQATKTVFGDLDEHMLASWKSKNFNYSVGSATAKLTNEALNLQTKGNESGNAQKLSAKIISDYCNGNGSAKKLLFPCGNLKQDVIEKSLKECGIDVDAVEVYETIMHEKLEDSISNLKKIDSIVFFSPSSVKFSFQLFKNYNFDLNSMRVIAIGPSTEQSLKNLNIKCYGVCKAPTVDCLLNILRANS